MLKLCKKQVTFPGTKLYSHSPYPFQWIYHTSGLALPHKTFGFTIRGYRITTIAGFKPVNPEITKDLSNPPPPFDIPEP